MPSLHEQLERLAAAGVRMRTGDGVARLLREHVPPDFEARPWELLLAEMARLDLTDAVLAVGGAPWSRRGSPRDAGGSSADVAEHLARLLGDAEAVAALGVSPDEPDVHGALARLAPRLSARHGLSVLVGRPADTREAERWARGDAWWVAFARADLLREATDGHVEWRSPVDGPPSSSARETSPAGTSRRWVCFPPFGSGFLAFTVTFWPAAFAVLLLWHVASAGLAALADVHTAAIVAGVLGLYPLATLLLNWRCAARRTDEAIRVRIGLLPWPGWQRLDVPRADVARVYVDRRLDSGGELASSEYAFTVCLALRDGRVHRVGGETYDEEKAEALRAFLAGG
ncbi:hypothetical protein L6R50_01885 [Myxococcota bacterium]|nr:hypothetical protein [Myxococcota bacterium]